MYRIKFVALLFILFTGITSVAQNAKEDFKKINEVYKKDLLSVDLVYQVYQSSAAVSPMETETGKMVKKGNASYLKIGSLEMIQNGAYNLMVDHELKIISLLEPEKTIGKSPEVFQVNLEQILKECKKVDFIKGNRLNQYVLELPASSEYSTIKVSFNPTTFFMERLELVYRNAMKLDGNEKSPASAPRLVIQSKMGSETSGSYDSFFSYTSFLKKENGKFICLEKYKDYQFINQLGN